MASPAGKKRERPTLMESMLRAAVRDDTSSPPTSNVVHLHSNGDPFTRGEELYANPMLALQDDTYRNLCRMCQEHFVNGKRIDGEALFEVIYCVFLTKLRDDTHGPCYDAVFALLRIRTMVQMEIQYNNSRREYATWVKVTDANVIRKELELTEEEYNNLSLEAIHDEMWQWAKTVDVSTWKS